MRDLVLFLGAGFSRDAALPVMSQFGRDADPKLFRLAKLNREMTEEFVTAATTYVQFRQALADRGALNRQAANNIETLFCVAEALREAGVPSMELDGCRVEFERIVSRLRLWIWKVYHQLPFYNSQRGRACLQTYRSFIDRLLASKAASRLTILTTNYDIVFEWIAHLSGLRCVYPLPLAEEWAVGAGPERFATLNPTDGEAIPILKLHGSVNYFERVGKDLTLLVATNISDGSPIAARAFTADIPAVVALDALAQIRRDCGTDGVAPAIVPPGYAKSIATGWLRETWSAAVKALQRAKAVLFIGYSMPPSDGLLSSVLTGSLGTRTGARGQPAIFVIDIDRGVVTRLKRVFGERVRESAPTSLRGAIDGELDRILAKMIA